MNSGRFTEGERVALGRLLAGLREILGVGTTEAALNELLRNAKPPAEDEAKIFEGRYAGLKPVLPVEPPPPIDRWKLLRSMLNDTEVQFIAQKHSVKLSEKYRRGQVRYYLAYVRLLSKEIKAHEYQVVQGYAESDRWNLEFLATRDLQRRWLTVRLHAAGIVYLFDGARGEKISNSAIEAMRAQFSFASVTA